MRVLVLDLALAGAAPAQRHYRAMALTRALRDLPEVETALLAEPWTAITLARAHRCNRVLALGPGAFPEAVLERLRALCSVTRLDAAALQPAAAPEFSAFPVADAFLYDVFHASGERPLPAAVGRVRRETARRGAASAFLPFRAGPAREGLDRVAPRELARFANLSLATVLDAGPAARADFLAAAMESALAGSPLLVQSDLAPWLEGWTPGQDYLAFHDLDELPGLLESLRADPSRRRRLALAGQGRVAAHHLYRHRAECLLRDLPDAIPPAPEARALHVLHVLGDALLHDRASAPGRLLHGLLETEDETVHRLYSSPAHGHYARLLDARGEPLRRMRFPDFLRPTRLLCDDREQAFSRLLREEGIDVVHIHDLTGHTPTLIPLAAALGVPVIWSARDDRALCHNADLRDDRGAACDPRRVTPQRCDVCLERRHGFARGRQAYRRTLWNAWLRQCAGLFFFRREALELHADLLPAAARPAAQALPEETPEAVRAVQAAYADAAGEWRWPRSAAPRDGKRLRVAEMQAGIDEFWTEQRPLAKWREIAGAVLQSQRRGRTP